jgi:hypothetical protein
MGFDNNILLYQLCIKCNSDMARLGNNLCKKCYVKPLKSDKTISKKDRTRKIYYYKFQNRDTKSKLLLNGAGQNIGIYEYFINFLEFYHFIL